MSPDPDYCQVFRLHRHPYPPVSARRSPPSGISIPDPQTPALLRVAFPLHRPLRLWQTPPAWKDLRKMPPAGCSARPSSGYLPHHLKETLPIPPPDPAPDLGLDACPPYNFQTARHCWHRWEVVISASAQWSPADCPGHCRSVLPYFAGFWNRSTCLLSSWHLPCLSYARSLPDLRHPVPASVSDCPDLLPWRSA